MRDRRVIIAGSFAGLGAAIAAAGAAASAAMHDAFPAKPGHDMPPLTAKKDARPDIARPHRNDHPGKASSIKAMAKQDRQKGKVTRIRKGR